jgi:hypothetical protein
MHWPITISWLIDDFILDEICAKLKLGLTEKVLSGQIS